MPRQPTTTVQSTVAEKVKKALKGNATGEPPLTHQSGFQSGFVFRFGKLHQLIGREFSEKLTQIRNETNSRSPVAYLLHFECQ
jgi:hypothetical protein